MRPLPIHPAKPRILDPGCLRRSADPACSARQAERDKLRDVAIQEHHNADIKRERVFENRQTEVLRREQQLAEQHLTLLAQNIKLTEEIARLTTELHAAICTGQNGDGPVKLTLTPQ